MNTPKTRTLSVIIPCYNEAETIAKVVEKVKGAPLPPEWQREIIIIDDGSKKDTLDVLRTLEDSAHIIYQEKNSGKGGAVKRGLRAATGDYGIIQDGDLELDPGQFRELLQPLIRENAQAVFGYRVLASRDHLASPVLFYGGRFISILFNLAFGSKYHDIPCCYKIFPRSCIPALLNTPNNDFVFDAIELTHLIDRQCTVAQVPVVYRPRSRTQGKKLRIRHGLYCAIAILLLRFNMLSSPIDREVSRFVRYLVSGVVTVLSTVGFLYILTEWLQIWYLAASVVAFTASYCINFFLHKFWTFKERSLAGASLQLPLHLGLSLINLALNTLIVFILVEYFHLWYLLAQIIAAGVIALESFLLLSRFIFK